MRLLSKMGSLYICGTPIGNLEDSTYRLKKVLGSVDLILCEDTRRAKTLLDYLEIETPYESFFIGNEYKKNSRIISKIKGGESIALISDAGMPTISDPGSSLIEGAIKENIDIVVIPGPSSVIASFSLTGFLFTEFTFLGFLEKKGIGRLKQIKEITRSKRPSIFFTSTKRLRRDLEEILDNGSTQEIVICRELTKIYETIYRGTASSLIKEMDQKDLKGEVTVVVNGATEAIVAENNIMEASKILLKGGSSKKSIAKALSEVSQYSVNEIYFMIQDS